jgi:hypothetical protein
MFSRVIAVCASFVWNKNWQGKSFGRHVRECTQNCRLLTSQKGQRGRRRKKQLIQMMVPLDHSLVFCFAFFSGRTADEAASLKQPSSGSAYANKCRKGKVGICI